MMRSSIVTLAILFAILAAPLRGELIESTAAGFLVWNIAAINAPPEKVYVVLAVNEPEPDAGEGIAG
jgi:hypothetical protein